jgi:hypothetical protein
MKANPSIIEILDHLDQMPKVSTDPVKPPDDEGVPFAKLHERPLQLRALHRVRYVDIELVDARLVQGLFLEVEAFAGRRDAGVSDELGQSVPPSMPPRGLACVTPVHLPSLIAVGVDPGNQSIIAVINLILIMS